MKRYFYTFCLLLITQWLIGQGTIVGTVVDAEENDFLTGVDVSLVGTSHGVLSDADGQIVLEDVPNGEYRLKITYANYSPEYRKVAIDDNLVSIGKIVMQPHMIDFKKMSDNTPLAHFRKSGISNSTISRNSIEKISSHDDFPTLLRSTPSVYVSRMGGGYGDSRVNIRGFGQENNSILLNGIQINNVEDNGINWAEWAGLLDAAQEIQVQRGATVTPIMTNSFGGSININTRTASENAGGEASVSIGNDGYNRVGLSLSTGRLKNDWAITLSGSRVAGYGYMDGTAMEAWSYFGTVNKRLNNQHSLQLIFMGTPEKHGTRSTPYLIGDEYEAYGKRYNGNIGKLNGEDFNMNEAYSHSPFISLNHYWDLNHGGSISTSLYYKGTQRARTYAVGGVEGVEFDKIGRGGDGLLQWDEIVKYNKGENSHYGQRLTNHYELNSDPFAPADLNKLPHDFINSPTSSYGLSQLADINLGNQVGIQTSYSQTFIDIINFSAGVDAYYYKGEHYSKIQDFMGVDKFLIQSEGINNDDWVDLNSNGAKDPEEFGRLIDAADYPIDNKYRLDQADRVSQDFSNEISRTTLFTKAEILSDFGISAFLSGAISNASMNRIYHHYTGSDVETGVYNRLGGNVKVGVNYNLDLEHNVYINGSFISKQPTFNNFINFNNRQIVNAQAVNEKALGGELGYTFQQYNYRAGISGYYMHILDRTTPFIAVDSTSSDLILTNLPHVSAVHKGIELDFDVHFFDHKLILGGMVAMNSWKWASNASVDVKNTEGHRLETQRIYIKDLKRGGAPQTSFALKANYNFDFGLSVDAAYTYYDRIYTDIDVLARADKNKDELQPLKLPSYGVADVGVDFNFRIDNSKVAIRGAVHNLLNTQYISDGNDDVKTADKTYSERIDTMRGWYGYGRTWNLSLKVGF